MSNTRLRCPSNPTSGWDEMVQAPVEVGTESLASLEWVTL